MSFKLPNFLHSGHLNGLRAEMGASLSGSYKGHKAFREIDLQTVRQLRDEGVDISVEDLTVLEDGTLAYKGYRVLVYIRDISNYGDRQSMPRFHLAFCKTLEMMTSSRRFGRYVVANREDGFFQVNFVEQGVTAQVTRLNVCQNCLSHIGWKGFSTEIRKELKMQQVESFSLQEFFQAYPRDLIAVKPEHTSDTSPINDYSDDWGDISEKAKARSKYTCSKCKLQLVLRETRFLHAHHINGLKHDNSDGNLEVLCVRCHAHEPMHSHMLNLPDYQEFIRKYPSLAAHPE